MKVEETMKQLIFCLFCVISDYLYQLFSGAGDENLWNSWAAELLLRCFLCWKYLESLSFLQLLYALRQYFEFLS